MHGQASALGVGRAVDGRPGGHGRGSGVGGASAPAEALEEPPGVEVALRDEVNDPVCFVRVQQE